LQGEHVDAPKLIPIAFDPQTTHNFFGNHDDERRIRMSLSSFDIATPHEILDLNYDLCFVPSFFF